jgi:single-strand DNA-binding protein
MASLNKVILIGNAGRDAELRYLASGTAQAQFSIAVSRSTRGADGEWTSETDWFNVIAWRELAERLSTQVTKGKQVYVEGRIQVRTWDNNEGQKQTRVEVVANQVLLLGRNEQGGGGGGGWDDGSGTSAPAPRSGGSGSFGGGSRPAGGGNWGGGNRGGSGSGGNFGGGGDIDPDDLPFE